MRPKRRAHGCFVNGKMDRDLQIFHYLTDGAQTATTVRQGNRKYTLMDDGTIVDQVDYDPDNPFDSGRVYREQPVEIWDSVREEVRVNYRDATTKAAFHAIEPFGGLYQYAFNRDHTRVAYVGIRYPSVSRRLQKMANGIIRRGEEQQGVFGGLLFASTTLLFNTYFGPLYFMTESSRRFHPVNHDKPWRKGYEHVAHYFLTPRDNLVAVVPDGKKLRVAIDEHEGPAFDQIANVRWLKDQNRVCYMGRRGNEIFRVIAH